MNSSPPQSRHPFAAGVPIAELDMAITGSTDLSGDKKERIEHFRIDDVKALERKYTIGRKLGQGSFGTVVLVQERSTGESYACKSLKKKAGSQKTYEQLQREVAIMKLVRHANIIVLHEVYETSKKIFLVMEHCGGGELDETIRLSKKCSDQDVRIIVRRISDAVGYLHAHGIVHRDIKPQNILLSTMDPLDPLNIKVSDFGLATWVDKCTMMDNVVGTPLYMAPEIIQNLPYSAQCDIWSIGVMTYLLLFGYQRDMERALQKMVAAGKIEYPPEYWKGIAPGARALCDSMLRSDPAKRISAREILMHPWIRGDIGVTYGIGQVNTTVLDLMRSYNTQLRLKKILRIVHCAVRFMAPILRRKQFHHSSLTTTPTSATTQTSSTQMAPYPPSSTFPSTSTTNGRKLRAGNNSSLASKSRNSAQSHITNSYSHVPRGTGSRSSNTAAAPNPLAATASAEYSIASGINRSFGSFNSLESGINSSTGVLTSHYSSAAFIGMREGSSGDMLGDMDGPSSGRTSKMKSSGRAASLDCGAPSTNHSDLNSVSPNINGSGRQTRVGDSMAASKFAQYEAGVTSLKKPPAGGSSRTKVNMNASGHSLAASSRRDSHGGSVHGSGLLQRSSIDDDRYRCSEMKESTPGSTTSLSCRVNTRPLAPSAQKRVQIDLALAPLKGGSLPRETQASSSRTSVPAQAQAGRDSASRLRSAQSLPRILPELVRERRSSKK
ncbi:kinase-like domain-containing protein [Chytriomyces cf. hyalinus JEL632]|nr:kinase-like domain-containing protein [Chytriomyces cf. hyalinus JEL632]